MASHNIMKRNNILIIGGVTALILNPELRGDAINLLLCIKDNGSLATVTTTPDGLGCYGF
jgi:hypothetical protein